MKKIVISLGGSLICPKEIDADFINSFKELLESYSKKEILFIVVCGGGYIARSYQESANSITKL